MKHKIKNIAKYAIPVDGTKLKPEPGQIVKAEITPKLQGMIKNKFFEDLGEIVEKEAKKKEEEIVESLFEKKEEEPEIKFNKFRHKKKNKEEMI